MEIIVFQDSTGVWCVPANFSALIGHWEDPLCIGSDYYDWIKWFVFLPEHETSDLSRLLSTPDCYSSEQWHQKPKLLLVGSQVPLQVSCQLLTQYVKFYLAPSSTK
jgi:hypothetical protein